MNKISRDDLTQRIVSALGPAGVIADEGAMAPYLEEWRRMSHGARARLIARPASTEQVAEVVRICAEAGAEIVPQGGNTGLCLGAQPDESGRQVILNLGRMNRVRAIDPVNFTMTVDAGAVLQTIQERADEAGCFFPLSLGAQGSCQIGGNISTNAGGVGVLRYGSTRALVLGLEVVLPDGTVWDGLKSLGKDNTGYDLKHLFIGAEGTLGIVTAAVLKLFPKPSDVQTAFCALADLDSALRLLARARAWTGDQVAAFELLCRPAIDVCLAQLPNIVDPLPRPSDWYVLMDLSTSRPGGSMRETMEELLAAALEAGEITDATIADSIDKANALWRIREELPEAVRAAGDDLHHDVSVPVADVPAFIRRTQKKLAEVAPGVRTMPFGHVGDGNIHFTLLGPEGPGPKTLKSQEDRMAHLIFDIAVDMRGSFSAEHGVGRLKLDDMARYKRPVEIDLMRRLKRAIDPRDTMNPGKVVRRTNA